MTEDRGRQDELPAIGPAGGDPATEPFEALYERLHTIAERLEGGGLPLEQSLALYEQGIELAQRCQSMLREAEQRIEVLRQRFEEPPGDVPSEELDRR